MSQGQPDLFPMKQSVRVETQAARNSDPDTSHEAAERITESGERERQAQRVLLCVKLYPGRTSAEIAGLMFEDRQMPARRLPELVTAGAVERGPKRKCAVAETNAITWWPHGAAPPEQTANGETE